MPAPDENDDVLVVIPCLNEESHLPGLLGQLLPEAGRALVVVADGGSCDRSRAIVEELAHRHANLILLDNPKRIQSAGINLAAQLFGRGRRWLIRLDAHAHYPAGYLACLKRAATAKGATSVVVPMVSDATGCFQRAAAVAQNSVLGTGGAAHRHVGEGQWIEHGHHALFDLPLFMAVGGYDENFAYNEDSELDRRLLAASGRIWLEPRAAITYYPRSAVGPLFRQYRNYGSGRARNLRRHPAPAKLRQMLPLAVVPACIAAVAGLLLAPVSAFGLALALPMIAWLVASFGAGALIGLRARSLCGMAAGIAAATMHLGWSLGFLEEALGRQPMPPPPQRLRFAPSPGQSG